MIFIFYKAFGKFVGVFFVEDDKIDFVKEFMVKVEVKGVKILFLIDVVVVDKFVEDVKT